MLSSPDPHSEVGFPIRKGKQQTKTSNKSHTKTKANAAAKNTPKRKTTNYKFSAF